MFTANVHFVTALSSSFSFDTDGVGGQEVVKVTCGSRHTALLTAAGKVIVM